jgi:hypothetical protein
MCGLTLLSLLVLSSQTHLVSIIYRTAGILIGAGLIRKFEEWDLGQLRAFLNRMVLPVIPLYVLAVIFINGLLSPHWQSLNEALATLDYRSLIPLWNDYIVSKAQAAASTVSHFLMYAPVGVMVWLRCGGRRRELYLAATVAFVFSFLIEVGRWLRAESSPDFTEAVVGACAAGWSVALMQWLWSMFESIGVREPKWVAEQWGEVDQSHLNKEPACDAD